MTSNSLTPQSTREIVRDELVKTRGDFHGLLDSLTEVDLGRQSLNPGWTNGEILAHITFGFLILNALLPMARLFGHLPKNFSKPLAWLLNGITRPFNWVNAMGARMQGKFFTLKRIPRIFDDINTALLKKVEKVRDEEWGRGMYFPEKWDSNFDKFMTLRKLFYYPIVHFRFHLTQIAR